MLSQYGRYPTDLSDAEWAVLEPLLPPPPPHAASRKPQAAAIRVRRRAPRTCLTLCLLLGAGHRGSTLENQLPRLGRVLALLVQASNEQTSGNTNPCWLASCTGCLLACIAHVEADAPDAEKNITPRTCRKSPGAAGQACVPAGPLPR